MGEPNPPPAAETETLKKIYAALNRGDIPAILAFFDPQIERIEPEGFPAAGTYRGLAEVEAHFSKARATWAEGTCEPERFFAADDKIVVFVHVRVRLKSSAEWLDGRLADVFTFRDGKAVQMRSYADKQQALDWAGVEAVDTD